ncbi:MAG: hypothetical protein AAF591_19705 [Verrucomicrobiota bacterium]
MSGKGSAPSPRAHKTLPLTLVVSLLVATLSHAATDAPTHTEIDPLEFEIGPSGKIKTMAMNAQGQLLCGVSWLGNNAKPENVGPRDSIPPGSRGFGQGSERIQADPYAGQHQYAIKIIDTTTGNVINTWPMEDGLQPKMIHGCDDGTVYVAGGGFLAHFDQNGNRLEIINTDEIYGEKALASGLCVGEADGERFVFLALGTGNSLRATEAIYRFNRDLADPDPREIIPRQYGCCAHIDIEVRNGEFLVAENSRHRVNRFTLDGKPIDTWGSRDRTAIEGFAACCNPCNTDFAADGALYTAESGVGRVKKYSQEGEYLGFVGYVDTTKFDRGSRLAAQSCYIPVEVEPDGSRVYIMDVRAHFIRVLQADPNAAAPKSSSPSSSTSSSLSDNKEDSALDFFDKK